VRHTTLHTSGLRVEVEAKADQFLFLVFVAVTVTSATHYFPCKQQANTIEEEDEERDEESTGRGRAEERRGRWTVCVQPSIVAGLSLLPYSTLFLTQFHAPQLLIPVRAVFRHDEHVRDQQVPVQRLVGQQRGFYLLESVNWMWQAV
jgi:hypothetical protein